jgi:hypothetical protein
MHHRPVGASNTYICRCKRQDHGYLPAKPKCRNLPPGLASLAVSLGAVTNASGTLTATATVTTVEYGMQGVVFAIDGHYVSAVMGGGPYVLKYGAAGLSSGSHAVTATVVDAVGVLALSGKQSVSTTAGVGPTGPIGPNVDPSSQDFDIAGNANDPINGAVSTRLAGRRVTDH